MPDIAPPHADTLTGTRMPSRSPDAGCHAVCLAVCSAMKASFLLVPSHSLQPWCCTCVMAGLFTQDWRPRSRKTLCRIRRPNPRRRTNHPLPRVAAHPQPPSMKYKPSPPLRLHPSIPTSLPLSPACSCSDPNPHPRSASNPNSQRLLLPNPNPPSSSVSRPIPAPHHRALAPTESESNSNSNPPGARGRSAEFDARWRLASPVRPGWWLGRRPRRRDLTLATDLGPLGRRGARRYEWCGRGRRRRRSGSMSGVGGGGSSSGDEFGRAVARAAVAQALEAAGFDCAHRSAVDTLVDILLRYVVHLGKAAAFHSNLAGRALANEYDIIQALEEIGTDFDGFAGAATSGRCLVGSGVVRDLVAFVESRDEVPFARPLPRFPVPRVEPQPAASFAVAGRETGMRHVPQWLPVFPDPHTYVRTEVWSEQAVEDRVDKVEQVRQRRKAEKSLLSLQQRLALAGADGFRPAVAEDSAEKGKEIQAAGSKRNPFLEPALPHGEEVSEVDMPPERKKLSVLEAFAPAIQGANSMELDDGTGLDQNQNQKSIVPKERAPVHLKIGVDKKPAAAALNSKALDLREDPSFLKEEMKDDRKRRAGLILRASLENPQELPQL